MLEPLARAGSARRIAWRHGDHAAVTPLLVTRAGTALPGAAILIPPGAPLPDAMVPVIEISGGFLEPAAAPGTTNGVWARIHSGTEQIIQSHLAQLRPPPRPAPLAELRDEDGSDGAARHDENTDEDAGAKAAGATGLAMLHKAAAAQGGTAHAQASRDQVLLGEEVAVAPWPAATAGDANRFAAALVNARETAGPARLLMTPGAGLVHHVALLVYAGVDLIDTLGVERASTAGLYLTSEAAHEATALRAPLCGCTDCTTSAPAEMDPAALLAHNLGALQEELTRVTGHLENGTLRELVETRARAHPTTAAVLRRLDRHHDHFAARWPLAGKGRLLATTQESITRPDVARYRARIQDAYQPPEVADVLLLLPCSARKPYARSQSHRIFRRVVGELGAAPRIHEVVLTSPIGVVPRELENTWPAAHYDVPVTGHWDREETHMIRYQLRTLLDKGRYKAVVSHLDAHTHRLIQDLLPHGTPHTGNPHPTSIPARDQLRRALQQATRGERAPDWPRRRIADAHAVLTWQMGTQAADTLLEHTGDVSGRPPGMRIYRHRKNKTPLATFVPQRGLFALTLDAARILHEAGCALCVQIDDFTPRGTLFAVGVRHGDERIVGDDEVVLVHEDEVRGIGRALMTGREMTAFPRGGAVEVRHHA